MTEKETYQKSIERLESSLDELKACYEKKYGSDKEEPERPKLAHGQIWEHIHGRMFTAIQGITGIVLCNNNNEYVWDHQEGFADADKSFTYVGMNPDAPQLMPKPIKGSDRMPTKEDADRDGCVYCWCRIAGRMTAGGW